MLCAPNEIYHNEAFDLETDLEAAILEVSNTLFGKSRIYVEVNK